MLLATGLAVTIAVANIPTSAPAEVGMGNVTPVSLPASLAHSTSEGGVPLVIDTDMGLDDWFAILYLLRREDLSVKAITVSGTGEAHCEPGVRNARGLLALAGYPQTPVVCGRDTPYAGGHSFPDEWRRGVDGLYGLTLPEAADTDLVSGMSAPQLIVFLAERHRGELSLLTLGPLTNLADALESDHALASKLASVYVMGGAVRVPGNVDLPGQSRGIAEWNIYADPRAASVVFGAGLPLVLVPLDATNAVPLDRVLIDRLGKDHGTSEADFAYRLLDKNRQMITEGSYYLWDTLAAALLTDSSPGSFSKMAVKVIEDGPESGRTAPATDGAAIWVTVSADRGRFEQLFLDVLNGRGKER